MGQKAVRKAESASADHAQELGITLEIDFESMLARLMKLHNKLLGPFSTHLEKRYDVTVNEFRLLMSIGRLGETAAHELAEVTGISTMNVSRTVAVLKRRDWIEVEPDPNHSKRKLIRLTAEGRRLFEAMRPSTKQVASYLFESLRPHDIAAFDWYLTSMLAQIDARDEAGNSIFLERTKPA
ncbi:MAG: MarR family winged helix-turn-helix transcriptional regulator [Spongiibacteraceae bacterium]|nr:MarR family winged helix-turn-helix transcriptional regulator [Spongiibacteraceae bacterium]